MLVHSSSRWPRSLPLAVLLAAAALLHRRTARELAPSLEAALQTGEVPAAALSASCAADATASLVFDAFGTSLAGKLALVTGGSSGIGLAVALAMAKRGATVVVAAHHEEKAAEAAALVRRLAGRGEVHSMAVELSSLASVRAFAEAFLGRFSSLDYLVLNAGIINGRGKTEDGYDEMFQVNFLSHALLTELLIEPLRSSRGLIVSTSSGASENACESLGACHTRFCECLSDFRWLPPPVVPPHPVVLHLASGPSPSMSSTYGISKWAQIYWTKAVVAREAARGSGVRGFSWTPGLVQTGLFDPNNASLPSGYRLPYWYRLPDQAAAVPALLVAAPDAFQNGGYFSRDVMCQDRVPVDHGLTDEMLPALLDHVNALVGLRAT
mmetsp:Transcript_16460/g.28647  ORF Transcript_16460/g.28647 Transcript_16460/m.28647 type:complete len:382 (-) Transcript_16460:238-1383(-)